MTLRNTRVQSTVIKLCEHGATVPELRAAMPATNGCSISQSAQRLRKRGLLHATESSRSYRYWSDKDKADAHHAAWAVEWAAHAKRMKAKSGAAATARGRVRRAAEKLARPPKPPKPKRVRKAAPKATGTSVKLRPNKLPSKPVKRGPAYLSGPLVFTDQTRRVVCPNVPQSLRTNTYTVY